MHNSSTSGRSTQPQTIGSSTTYSNGPEEHFRGWFQAHVELFQNPRIKMEFPNSLSISPKLEIQIGRLGQQVGSTAWLSDENLAYLP